jgi:glycosyltransferase involved in cell wall biosynthesis
MRLAVVVQRYGADINGGAELHARYLAEHLSRHAEVRVLTTCARDYMSWKNDLPAGNDVINGVPVERYPVSHERDLQEFSRLSTHVFSRTHSLEDELRWLDCEGPTCPSLVKRVSQTSDTFDFLLLFSARYYQTYHSARVAAERAILVPTAERDPALGLGMFEPIFRGVRAIMYNTPEERALIQAVSGNSDVPDTVVGIGSEIPESVDAARGRRTFALDGPFVIYVGRIDANKGCVELFDFFTRYHQHSGRALTLVLVGSPVLEIPSHPYIRHLGFISEQDKFDVLAAAEALLMPSYYESLSMVVLEAWALGRPVIANAKCDVLVGQCLRSHAGLYYENVAEFAEALDLLLDDPSLATRLGENGREYYAHHYSWPVIEQKYLDMFSRLSDEPDTRRMEPLPGWLARRRRTLMPAEQVIARLPSGPAIDHARGVEA